MFITELSLGLWYNFMLTVVDVEVFPGASLMPLNLL